MSPAGPPLTQTNPIGNLLGHGLQIKPEEPALISGKRCLTFRQLAEISEHLALQYLALRPKAWRPGR